jgi:hypothetical protein
VACIVASKVPRPGAPSEAVTVVRSIAAPFRTVWTTSVASKTLAVPVTWNVGETCAFSAGRSTTIGGSTVAVGVFDPPHPAARAPTARTTALVFTSADSRGGPSILWAVSVIALVLLAAAVLLLAAAEWPRLARRGVLPQRKPRPKKRHLRVVEAEHDPDEFQRSVERDLANLPTYDPRANRD